MLYLGEGNWTFPMGLARDPVRDPDPELDPSPIPELIPELSPDPIPNPDPPKALEVAPPIAWPIERVYWPLMPQCRFRRHCPPRWTLWRRWPLSRRSVLN